MSYARLYQWRMRVAAERVAAQGVVFVVSVRRASRRLLICLVCLGLGLTAVSVPAAGTTRSEAPVRQTLELPEERIVRVFVPGSEALYRMQDAGYDFTGNAERVPAGIEVDVLVTDAQLEGLDEFGATRAGETHTQRVAPRPPRAAEVPDTVVVGRVDWFSTKDQGFLSVEAKSSAEDAAVFTVSWEGGSDDNVRAFVDSGEYMYHRKLIRIDGPRPDTITVTSSLGGEAAAEVEDWLYPTDTDIDRPGYEYGFIDGYMSPTELYERIEELADEYPNITEIVELPHRTNGYRRLAQAVFGSSSASRVAVDSVAWGHEGGNEISVELADPGAPDQPLSVAVNGNAIRVSLGTDAGGQISSTAALVVAALNAEAGSLITAYTYRGNAGNGIVAPAPPTLLSDFLSAPDEVPNDPYQVRALRIGKYRDGSRPAVLVIAQDHAREWVTPLVALETAERLLANYRDDPMTRRVVNKVDILIVPSNNPDGSHYSFFDRAFQRRNMTNYCPRTGAADALARGSWGVDLNRNYRVGSAIDGYDGASFSCTSDTYMGPDKLSEPEAKNIVWLAENFDNLKFFMTVHSYGGQLFWQPGAYIAEGRVTTPRPPLRDEEYYWEMAEEILSNVKTLRDSVVQPGSVGGSADVLYSSAGNVREDLYNNYGIYSFGWEVGGEQWDPEADGGEGDWDAPGGFQPEWPEADQQYQEYASGVIKMFEIAMKYGMDNRPPSTRIVLEPRPGGTVHVSFRTNEPATIHYTMDGGQATPESPMYEAAAIREPGEVIVIDERTKFRWIAIDVKENVSEERMRTVPIRSRASSESQAGADGVQGLIGVE